MTNREVIDFLKVISKELQLKNSLHKRVGIDSEDKFTGNGSTISYFDTVIGSSIGIKELCDNPDARTDNYTFMKAFISILHEYTHIYQREILLHEKGNSVNYLAIGYAAEAASPVYYNNINNYKLMPHEISAQYSALKNGYNILSQFVGKKKANSMICDYVNKHIEDEFIKNPGEDYSNVEAIFDDYEKAFKEAKTTKREFDKKEYESKFNELRRESPDKTDVQIRNDIIDIPLKCFLDEKLSGRRSKFITAMENSKPGIYQDFILAQVYSNANNENREKYKSLEALSSINFSNKFPSLKKTPEQIRFLNLASVTPEFSFSKDDLQDKDEYNLDDFDI
jgi:hypothetical protein